MQKVLVFLTILGVFFITAIGCDEEKDNAQDLALLLLVSANTSNVCVVGGICSSGPPVVEAGCVGTFIAGTSCTDLGWTDCTINGSLQSCTTAP